MTNIVLCKLDDFVTRQVMIDMGGFRACLSAMERHPHHPGTNANGCHLIGNFWWYPSAVVRQTVVVDKGGLKLHKEDGLVQSYGCFALSSLLHSMESTPWSPRLPLTPQLLKLSLQPWKVTELMPTFKNAFIIPSK